MDFVIILSYLFGEGEETQQRLRSANCTTPERLSALKPEKLSGITGLSRSHSECMINYAMKILRDDRSNGLNSADAEETKDTAGSTQTRAKHHSKDRAVIPTKRRPTRTHKATRASASKPNKSPRKPSSTASGSPAPSDRSRRLSATRSVRGRRRAREKPETSPENVKSFWRFG